MPKMKPGGRNMKKGKAKKKIAARKKTIVKRKSKPKAKSKPHVKYLTINPEKDDVFDEVEELRRIETCLDIIFGHLRRIKSEGGEGSLKLILDYFYSKYGTRFLARQ
jgi:hypothetical protein